MSNSPENKAVDVNDSNAVELTASTQESLVSTDRREDQALGTVKPASRRKAGLWIALGLGVIVAGGFYVIRDPSVYEMLLGKPVVQTTNVDKQVQDTAISAQKNVPDTGNVLEAATKDVHADKAMPMPTPVVDEEAMANMATSFSEASVATEDEIYSGIEAAVSQAVKNTAPVTSAIMPDEGYDFVGTLPNTTGSAPSSDGLVSSSVSSQRVESLNADAVSIVGEALGMDADDIGLTAVRANTAPRKSLSQMIAEAPTVHVKQKDFIKIRN